MFNTLDPRLTIKELKILYCADRFQFEFNCSMYLAGDAKKQLRQDIVKELTGKQEPKSKCGLHLVSDILKAHFEQPTLF